MIIDAKKIIFCHIDKTGGSSITVAIVPNFNIESDENPVPNFMGKHDTMKQLINKRSNADEYFKFSFVRNPYARAVSKYFHHVKLKHQRFDPPEANAHKMTFDEWVKQGGLSKMKTQYNYIYHENKNLCDFVGRFENINEDFETVRERFDYMLPLSHYNNNKTDNYDKDEFMKYYGEESLKIVNRLFHIDFTAFNYDIIENL